MARTSARARANNDAPEPNNTPNLWAQQYFVSVINDCQSTVARAVDVNYSLGILLADKNEGTRWSINFPIAREIRVSIPIFHK